MPSHRCAFASCVSFYIAKGSKRKPINMEQRKADVEVVVVAPTEDDEGALSDSRPMGRSGSLSDNSTPYITDSDGDEFCDAKDEAEDSKPKIVRRSSTIKLTSELKDKIISQTEFLFSDENLEKDGFLLKHVKRNKEGYVNLKLLSSFKKMRSICKDYKVICEALKDSTMLLMNEECTKIKRRNPLPDKLFEQPPVRYVVVSNMKTESPSMDYISDLFKEMGEIVSVRIIRHGKKYPADLQSHFAHNPDLMNETVAVVEFECAETAAKVVKEGLNDSHKDIRITLLHLGAKQLAKRTRQFSGGSDTRSGSEDVNSSKEEDNNSLKVGRSKKTDKKKGNRLTNDRFKDESCPSSSDNDATFAPFSSYKRRYQNEGSRSQGNSPFSSPKLQPKNALSKNSPGSQKPDKLSPRKGNSSKVQRELKLSPLAKELSPATSPEIRRKQTQSKVVVESSSLPNSPWITRRKLFNKDMNDNVASMNGKLNAFGLIRQPKGPDGTKGFVFNSCRIAIPT